MIKGIFELLIFPSYTYKNLILMLFVTIKIKGLLICMGYASNDLQPFLIKSSYTN